VYKLRRYPHISCPRHYNGLFEWLKCLCQGFVLRQYILRLQRRLLHTGRVLLRRRNHTETSRSMYKLRHSGLVYNQLYNEFDRTSRHYNGHTRCKPLPRRR